MRYLYLLFIALLCACCTPEPEGCVDIPEWLQGFYKHGDQFYDITSGDICNRKDANEICLCWTTEPIDVRVSTELQYTYYTYGIKHTYFNIDAETVGLCVDNCGSPKRLKRIR